MHLYTIQGKEYYSGVEVLATQNVKLLSQFPVLSYWKNGVVPKDHLEDFLQEHQENSRFYLREGQALGEDPLKLLQPEDLKQHLENIALLITAVRGAHFYRKKDHSLVFYLDDEDKWARGSYVPFESYLNFETPEAAERRLQEMVDVSVLVWGYPANIQVSSCLDQKELLKEKIRSKLQQTTHPKGREALERKISSLTPEGYLPLITW